MLGAVSTACGKHNKHASLQAEISSIIFLFLEVLHSKLLAVLRGYYI
jgi:hypothetical protein